MDSLADYFHELDLDLALLTETWFQSNIFTEEKLADFAGNFSLDMLIRNRSAAAANGRQYGGVAIACRQKTTTVKPFPILNPNDYEILAVQAKTKGIREKLTCIVAYIPPNYIASEARGCIEYISDVITEIKRKVEDGLIVLGGDFNQWPIADLLEEHPDFTEIDHGPTRGDRKIDRLFVNFGRSVSRCDTLTPLDCDAGGVSDHKVVFVEADFVTKKQATITYSYRRYTDLGGDRFVEMMSEETWKSVRDEIGPNMKAKALAAILDNKMASCFPLTTTTKKEGEDPWINHTVRKQSRKRRVVFDKEGRSAKWKKMKRETEKLVEARAEAYMQNQKRDLLGPDAVRCFHKNIKAYKAREKPPNFEPRDLFPGLPDKEVAENLAEHFGSISNEFGGLDPAYAPPAFAFTLPLLTPSDVEARLKSFRKTKSRVQGDLFPCLINRVARSLSFPLAEIYNGITAEAIWPEDWKVEFVTPIPKTSHPATVNDLRNISCTLFISKVYESFVLAWLQQYVTLRKNQYGGVRGSGTEHFLIDLWQRVLESLEDQRAAAVLTSLDFSKAFNRLDFNHCLRALESKGAPPDLLRIIAAFLSGRTMRVKVGNEFSDSRVVSGGVPQGSLLGVHLFNTAIDSFEEGVRNVINYSGDPDLDTEAENPPVDGARDYLHLPQWRNWLIQLIKYVDDNIINETINFEDVQTDVHGFRTKKAEGTETLVEHIVQNAEDAGMVINPTKTQMMCISDAKSYNARTFIRVPSGEQVQPVSKMKILGFWLSNEPHMDEQVRAIKKKFMAKKWFLTHLGHRGFNQQELLQVYQSIILPAHDYCSNVYTSALTKKQESELERMQAIALKGIFGYEYSYRELLASTGLTTLKDRRNERLEKFAIKATRGRFCHWFPLNDQGRNTRHTKKYKETFARTERLKNSPIFTMRRKLNELESRNQ